MSLNLNIAIVGAATPTGKAVLFHLQQSDLDIQSLTSLVNADDDTDRMQWRGQPLAEQALGSARLADFNVLFACELTDADKELIDRAIDNQCYIIEVGSNIFDAQTLLASENADISASIQHYTSVSGTACILHTLLKPLQQRNKLINISATIMLPVSARGKAGIEELATQTASLLNAKPVNQQHFSRQIAFNLMPDDAQMNAYGYTQNEQILLQELQYGLGLDAQNVSVSMIYVPVFYGESMDIRLTLDMPLEAGEVNAIWQNTANIIAESDDEILTPVSHAAEGEGIFFNRLRFDSSQPKDLGLWVVSDPIRWGSAINGVQIAEILVKDYL